MVLIKRAGEHRHVPWKNGLGVTIELHVDGPADDWDWRLSAATVDVDGPFSVFDGIDRSLTVIDGTGMRLAIGQASVDCRPLVPVEFPGDIETHAQLIDGPIRDLNLMTRRGRTTGRVEIRSVDGAAEPVQVDPAAQAIVALSSAELAVGRYPIRLGTLDLVIGLSVGEFSLCGGCIAVVFVDRTSSTSPRAIR